MNHWQYTFPFSAFGSLAAGISLACGEFPVVNEDGDTYDSHPSAVVRDDGSTWIAWHAYHRNRDSVLARHIGPEGDPGPIHEVSDPDTPVNGPPQIVATANTVWVVWPASAGKDHAWQIQARRFPDEKKTWQPIETVSGPAERAIYPAAWADEKTETILVAWSGHRDGRFRIRCRQCSASGSWLAPIDVSPDEVNAFRPAIEAGPGPDGAEKVVRVFWDQYDGDTGNYTVKGRAVLPRKTAIEQVSPPGEHCLTPTALATSRGLFVAWLRKADVIGGPGIISQMHTLQAGRRSANGSWTVVRDADGGDAAAELTQGLMAKVQPNIVATGGYLGRRVAPLLLDAGDSVWLLWERKSNHGGSTPNNLGDLLGRPIEGGEHWGVPVRLHQERVDYHLTHPAIASADGKFSCLASKLPRNYRRRYERFEFDLSETTPFEQDEWTGWNPVALPIPEEQPGRQAVTIDDKEYKLYWGDFHCHSGLTADAEGEPDEMMYYARDRARLDVVAFTNNDFIYDVPLTQYEYALGNMLAQVETRPGEFIAMPGFEWTSRVPGIEGVPDGDPANYTPPYKNKSYPNHRSVVYPPSGGPLVHYHEVDNDIAVLNEAVRRAGGITLTQHAAFRASGHPVEVGMELTSGWGNYINKVPDLFHDPLNGKARLGFVACGDTHRRAPGLAGALTGLYLEELSAEAVLDALRNRRCFATAGSKILLDSRANGAFMGEDTTAPERQATLTLRAVGTRPIRSAILIRDGEQIASFKGTEDRKKDVTFTHVDRGLESGTHWYYWEVRQEREAPLWLPGNAAAAHGHLAWSSPHWVVAP